MLLALSVAWPIGMAPKADLFKIAESTPFDVFYNFWIPLSQRIPASTAWGVGLIAALVAALAPVWSKPRADLQPPASFVNEHLCQSCKQCYLDCPYEAIDMVSLPENGKLVARVDPALCVSCGICAGSCAPMGVGPPGRTGRDQLKDVKDFVTTHATVPGAVVLVACTRGARGVADASTFADAPVFPIDCVGSLHTSTVEYLVRSGAAGVLITACPSRDCWNREGVKWLYERLYNDREAELKARVDRRRVRVAHAAEGELLTVLAALSGFREHLQPLDDVPPEGDIELDTLCEADKELVP